MVKMLAPGPFPRRPSGFVKYGIVAIVFLLALYTFNQTSRDAYPNTSTLRRPLPDAPTHPGGTRVGEKPPQRLQGPSRDDAGSKDTSKSASPQTPSYDSRDKNHHPIDKLIYDAQHHFAELISKESKTIHHDIEPFWGLNARLLRREASQFEMTISVRDGNATSESDWFWTKIWLNMIKEIEQYLPDMDLALNAMDEPRLVIPWEDINRHMTKAAKTAKLPKVKTVVAEFQKLPKPGKGELRGVASSKKWEKTKPYWPIVRRGCPPDSPARKTALQESFAKPPTISTKHAEPHLYKGYVSNYTMSNELCHQPDLQGLEGILIEPLSVSATKTMFPMFGGSKLTVNNEILLPAPMYWNEEERFTGGNDHGVPWTMKRNTAIWRGVATGGLNRENNWRGFQRHRFVSMSNGTKVSQVESGEKKPENFALAEDRYGVQPQKDHKLGEWIKEWSDVGFIDLSCDPPQDGKCNYTDFYYHPIKGLKMAEQFSSKFLPDIDGNSFSGRYLGFLRSTSLPIKATIWREWHDSRLVPWKHFVPMDNRFSDYYGIMEYFLGYRGQNNHDHAAEKIAAEGKEWAEQVLRKEDMLVYVMRLLLEYARVVDDRREAMGWVGDALKDPSLETSWTGWR
ncbi:Beta-1,2-xylosyltransferase 1 [Tolypocladium capitatum]|uniref:Beta-1,2-xylosyltransferase 1 n=1 Tax=Tolypocladium capitatum TaxID=45235 RepID=A0A2K3QIV3_9HYPO|nr:Beta-1,2-xylosyltransferase 1 [Tolypocladium capitatum]